MQHHGVSRLPDIAGDKPDTKTFKRYLVGCSHIDIAEVQTREGNLYLYVDIDLTSKSAFAEFVEKVNAGTAGAFLTALVVTVPYKINIF